MSAAAPRAAAAPRPARPAGAWLVGVPVAVILAAGGHDLGAGGFEWSDAPLHAMDGVFVRELARQRPPEPMEWAAQFYARHPCLGMVVYYPPFFAAVEAAVYAVAGVSAGAARATVLLFALGAVALLFAWLRGALGTAGALAACIVLVLTPDGLRWLRDVMLEWPAVCGLAAVAWAYGRWQTDPGWKWSGVAAASACGAFLIKQTAGFIAVAILVDVLLDRELRRRAVGAAAVIPAAAAAGIVAAYLWLTAPYTQLPPLLLAGTQPWGHLGRLGEYAYYLMRLPEIAGWPVVGLAVLGVVRLCWGRTARLLWVWFGLWWAISTLMAAKEPRYFFFALVPVAAWAGNGLAWLVGTLRDGSDVRRVAASAAILATGAVQGASVWPQARGRLESFAPVVRALAADPRADLVLVDSVRDGQFVFDGWIDPVARVRLIPLRASKVLYSRAARTAYLYEEYIRTPQEIVGLLDRHGIRFVLVESGLPEGADASWDPPPRRLLRRLVADDARFERRAAWACGAGSPAWRGVELVLYEYTACPERSVDEILLPVPAMGRSVKLPLAPRGTASGRSGG